MERRMLLGIKERAEQRTCGTCTAAASGVE
jgi:hypothetical protein